MRASPAGRPPTGARSKVNVAGKKRIEVELKRRNAFLQLLQVVSVAANGAPTSLTHALQTTVDEVCSQTDWTVGHVLLAAEDDPRLLTSSGIWHVDRPGLLAELRHRHDDISFAPNVGIPGRVFSTGKPEHIADVRSLSADDCDRVRCTVIDTGNMRSVAGFPIIAGDEVCGVLEFFAEKPFAADRLLLDVMVQVGLVLGRIVERTRYEAALRGAREVAEGASAAKSEFLSRMSHELRTPLTAVLGYADLLKLSPLPAEERGYVAAIDKGGSHLLDLINDVLDLARLDKGELRMSMQPVDVAVVVLDAAGLMQPLAAANTVSLKTDIPGRAKHFALSDRQGLKQILLNLVANGIKYNRAGGGVAINVIAAGKGTVQIDVVDTGNGIAAKDLESIFVPFERLGAARTVEGTGLGLGISRRLVEAMGGTLQVLSTVGSGTTFSIALTASERPAELGPRQSISAATARAPGASRTVLYVEDNIVNIELMQKFFTRLRPGIELVSTMLGELAVDLAREHKPHLILLDVNLPDIDGEEVMRRLNMDERTRAIPVVIVSADAIPSGIAHYLEAGAIGYITKPIEVALLLGFVDQATGGFDSGEVVHDIAGRRPRLAELAAGVGVPAGAGVGHTSPTTGDEPA